MPGPLTHSPADVLAQVLVILGQVALPTPGTDWSVSVGLEPDSPERCVTLFDTDGLKGGRLMAGEVSEHHGVQVRVRAEDHPACYEKINAICTAMDAQYDTVCVIDGVSYLLHCCNRSGPILSLYKQSPATSRSVFVANYLLSLRKLPL